MSHGLIYLHSHSGLERFLAFPKHIVLVDAEFEELFPKDVVEPFRYNKVDYVKVPILMFVDKGGVFKNLMK